MGTRVWNFLLPGVDGGRHQLRAENLGSPGQAIFIDGEQQGAREALIFSGPGNSLLELRKGQAGQWHLLVNGLMVEDYHEGKRRSGDETLRELRGRPDGSYLISTEIDVANLDNLHLIRKFRFKARGNEHEIWISHRDCIWQVLCDGKLIERAVHKLSDSNGKAFFKLEVADGRRLDAALHMTWNGAALLWRYRLTVNNVEIPLCWSKVVGNVHPPPELPELLPADSAEIPGNTPEPALSEQTEEPEPQPQPSAMQLPQGVSFDPFTGAFQANIRGRTGKFVFLGEFRTPEEAHQCYLEAVPLHCPDKILAPEIPA